MHIQVWFSSTWRFFQSILRQIWNSVSAVWVIFFPCPFFQVLTKITNLNLHHQWEKMTLVRKLHLVLWKNLLIRKRHWILTLIEIVIPVLLFIVVASVRSEMHSSDDILHPVSYFDIWTEGRLIRNGMMSLSSSSLLLYAPDNNFTQRIIAVVSSQLKVGK